MNVAEVKDYGDTVSLQESFGLPIAVILRFPDLNTRRLRLKSEDKGERFASPVPNFLSMTLSPLFLSTPAPFLGWAAKKQLYARALRVRIILPTAVVPRFIDYIPLRIKSGDKGER